MSAPPLLDAQGISVDLVRRGAREPILRDVSFQLRERQVLGIIGESGSGKTVLSRVLCNAISEPLEITAGSVGYHGRDLLTIPAEEMQALRGREIGYIGSDPGSALDPTIPVGHQIVEKLRAVQPEMSKEEARERALEVLSAVRMPRPERRFDEFPFQYSGGMMQRALIVDALVSNPTFLIADNVTQQLDVTVAAQIIRLMHDLRDRAGHVDHLHLVVARHGARDRGRHHRPAGRADHRAFHARGHRRPARARLLQAPPGADPAHLGGGGARAAQDRGRGPPAGSGRRLQDLPRQRPDPLLRPQRRGGRARRHLRREGGRELRDRG